MSRLVAKAIVGLACVSLAMAALLFGLPQTLDYWQAWMFLAVYLAPSVAMVVWLAVRDPALLERRIRGGPLAEKEPRQKVIMWITSAGFVALLAVAGLDRRNEWSHMPALVAAFGDLLVGLGWWLSYRVFRENAFASATIEQVPGQEVISTGPYALVRHPMYAGGMAMFFGIPIALGSWWAAVVVLALLPALAWRMLDEERFLKRSLPGYAAYMERVRYRLIPHVW